jgi:hypothetical protein
MLRSSRFFVLIRHLALGAGAHTSRDFYLQTIGLDGEANDEPWGVRIKFADGFMFTLIPGDSPAANAGGAVHFGCALPSRDDARSRAGLRRGLVAAYTNKAETPYVGFRSIARMACALTIGFGSVASFAATAPPASATAPLVGYWGTDSGGMIRRSGDAPDLGDLSGVRLNAPIVGIAPSFDGQGFWLAAADGGVFSFGDAKFFGSAANLHLNAPIVGIAAYGDRGYLLAAADGGVFSFGAAQFQGSAANLHLNAPIVGIALAAGGGYRLAASDGGVFTFGDAKFFGSAGNLHLSAPIVGIASQAGFPIDGYILAASDGGVFTYGGAVFSGTSGRTPISAIASSSFDGYELQSAYGGSLSAFGNASSCVEPQVAPPARFDSLPRFVGVAGAFLPGRGDVEGSMATVSCRGPGGDTGSFHAPASWHIEVEKSFLDGGAPCYTEVFARDRVHGQPVPTQPLVAKYGRIRMERTQVAGHSVFDVRVTGTNCRAVATKSVFQIAVLPLPATTRLGDIGPFWTSSQNPPSFTLRAHGTCTTEFHDAGDGRLLRRLSGTSYTTTVPSGGYWISNTRGCTVSIT